MNGLGDKQIKLFKQLSMFKMQLQLQCTLLKINVICKIIIYNKTWNAMLNQFNFT